MWIIPLHWSPYAFVTIFSTNEISACLKWWWLFLHLSFILIPPLNCKAQSEIVGWRFRRLENFSNRQLYSGMSHEPEKEWGFHECNAYRRHRGQRSNQEQQQRSTKIMLTKTTLSSCLQHGRELKNEWVLALLLVLPSYHIKMMLLLLMMLSIPKSF